MSNRRAERKEMAVAESRSMSLLTLLEPARNAAGTTQAVYSAVTQPLVVATTEACHWFTYIASTSGTTEACGQLLLPQETPKRWEPRASHSSPKEKKLPLPPTFQPPISFSNWPSLIGSQLARWPGNVCKMSFLQHRAEETSLTLIRLSFTTCLSHGLLWKYTFCFWAYITNYPQSILA